VKLAFLNRGIAYGRKREYQRAIADFSEAIRVDSQFAAAFCNRGRAKQAKGDRSGGIADTNRAKQISPSSCR